MVLTQFIIWSLFFVVFLWWYSTQTTVLSHGARVPVPEFMVIVNLRLLALIQQCQEHLNWHNNYQQMKIKIKCWFYHLCKTCKCRDKFTNSICFRNELFLCFFWISVRLTTCSCPSGKLSRHHLQIATLIFRELLYLISSHLILPACVFENLIHTCIDQCWVLFQAMRECIDRFWFWCWSNHEI